MGGGGGENAEAWVSESSYTIFHLDHIILTSSCLINSRSIAVYLRVRGRYHANTWNLPRHLHLVRLSSAPHRGRCVRPPYFPYYTLHNRTAQARFFCHRIFCRRVRVRASLKVFSDVPLQLQQHRHCGGGLRADGGGGGGDGGGVN